ncbi:hypothetical protein VM1G_06294 [Cytospora mali]|uniref:Uncharacterized protein n=1 Tax=Cytospora mali TaxID=578113 RepID=A0A194W255_CYTMA|nr:hypothetical protein VM1G_06294 [Valsa mali]
MSNRADILKSQFGDHTAETLRPILTSLNGDGSWLMSFPLPSPSPRKRFYHIVTDAWLNGPATQGTSWFICIDRLVPPAATNGAGVDHIIREIEGAVGGDTDTQDDEQGRWLDAIFVNFHYLDHMHQPTLVTFDKTIPVFATPEAAGTIQSWGHFDTVVTTRDFGGSDLEPASNEWDCHPGAPLPLWLSVFRIPGDKELNFATAIIWSHDATKNKNGSVPRSPQGFMHEVFLNTPHGVGVNVPTVQAFFKSISKFNTREGGIDKVEILALFAALKDSFAFGMRTTLGLAGSLELERLSRPRYWVRTHDSTLLYRGVFMRLIRVNDVSRTLDQGLEEEAKAQGKTKEEGERRRPNFVDVASGECFVLG